MVLNAPVSKDFWPYLRLLALWHVYVVRRAPVGTSQPVMARIHSAETGCVYIFQLPQTVSPSFAVLKSNFGWQFGH